MIYLVDTNVLLRFANRADPRHLAVRASVRKLRGGGHELRMAAQNGVEFWNVATRPVANNGWGLAPIEADRMLRLCERLFPMLPESTPVYPRWRQLVANHGVLGVQVHDARLVATMQAHAVTHILTLNVTDFARYALLGIVACDPLTV